MQNEGLKVLCEFGQNCYDGSCFIGKKAKIAQNCHLKFSKIIFFIILLLKQDYLETKKGF